MEDIVYKDMIKQENEHWWFKARREILDNELSRLNLSKKISILEIGCGTGGNIEMLKKYGNVRAMEMDMFSVEYAKKHEIEVKKGHLPEMFPFEDKFDLICIFDVLEHIDKDEESLKIIQQHLSENGILVVTVPAYQWLFGSHDKLLHHKRRYTKSRLIHKLRENKFDIIKSTYFNTLLFPLVIISRIIDLIKTNDKSIGYGTPNKVVNTIFYNIFKIEKYILKKINFIYGTSILIVSEKGKK